MLYAKDFLPVAVGLESREAFLQRMAPDYQTASFVDLANAFRELESDGKLTPIASKTIESLAGNSRIYKQTAAFKATILQLEY